jgi:hypothetical protein
MEQPGGANGVGALNLYPQYKYGPGESGQRICVIDEHLYFRGKKGEKDRLGAMLESCPGAVELPNNNSTLQKTPGTERALMKRNRCDPGRDGAAQRAKRQRADDQRH